MDDTIKLWRNVKELPIERLFKIAASGAYTAEVMGEEP